MSFLERDPDGGEARLMSLRDYFAGQVLAGLCSQVDASVLLLHSTGEYLAEAQLAYALADKMLEVRGQ
jgi:hypothetical protein